MGQGLVGRFRGASGLSQARTPPHTCHIAAACSHVCGFWWMGAFGCRPPSLRMPAAIPVCPATASPTRLQPQPTSLCSVRSLTPAPLTARSLPRARPSASCIICHCFPPDPAQVTAMPPETPLPIGMRGVIRCPVRANPPLLFVSWTKDGQALQLDKVQACRRGAGEEGLSFLF